MEPLKRTAFLARLQKEGRIAIPKAERETMKLKEGTMLKVRIAVIEE